MTEQNEASPEAELAAWKRRAERAEATIEFWLSDIERAQRVAQKTGATLGTSIFKHLTDLCERLWDQVHSPELNDFAAGVVREAVHQRERWGAAHDAGKDPQDWFWLLGYLGGKALAAAMAGDREKALHHTISTAAALANWHAQLLGAEAAMRPGIGPGNAAYETLAAPLDAAEPTASAPPTRG